MSSLRFEIMLRAIVATINDSSSMTNAGFPIATSQPNQVSLKSFRLRTHACQQKNRPNLLSDEHHL